MPQLTNEEMTNFVLDLNKLLNKNGIHHYFLAFNVEGKLTRITDGRDPILNIIRTFALTVTKGEPEAQGHVTIVKK